MASDNSIGDNSLDQTFGWQIHTESSWRRLLTEKLPSQPDRIPMTLCPSLTGSYLMRNTPDETEQRWLSLSILLLPSVVVDCLHSLSILLLLVVFRFTWKFLHFSWFVGNLFSSFLNLQDPEGSSSSPERSGRSSSSSSEKLKRGGGKRSIKQAPGREKKFSGVNHQITISSREPILKAKRLNYDSSTFRWSTWSTSWSICSFLEAKSLCLFSPRGEGRKGGKKEGDDGQKERR